MHKKFCASYHTIPLILYLQYFLFADDCCRMSSSSRTATKRPILLGIPSCSHGLSFPDPCPPCPDPDDNSSHSDVPSTDHSPSSNPFLPRFRPTPPTATDLGTFLRVPFTLSSPHLMCCHSIMETNPKTFLTNTVPLVIMVLGYNKISCSYFTLDSKITLPLALLNIFHLLPIILSWVAKLLWIPSPNIILSLHDGLSFYIFTQSTPHFAQLISLSTTSKASVPMRTMFIMFPEI